MAQCTDRMDGMDRDQIRNAIEQGNTALGIEFGSTRIKAVLVDGKNKPIAQGSYCLLYTSPVICIKMPRYHL